MLEHHDAPPWEFSECCASHHHIGVLLGSWHGERWIDGRHRSEMAPRGSLSIIPASLPFASRWQSRSQAIVLALDPFLLRTVAHEAVGCDRIELNFCWLQLKENKKQEGDRPPARGCYAYPKTDGAGAMPLKPPALDKF